MSLDGNGFKTSTMRLGADVIVFSRCQGEGRRFHSLLHRIFIISYVEYQLIVI